MTTMKAAIVPEVNAPWNVQTIEQPEPGPNQVLIKIHASGLCYTDVHITQGTIKTQFPRTLGHEPVGEIVAIGEGVRTRQVGDRVGVPWVQASCGRCEWCQRGKPMYCAKQLGTGVQLQGSHAEYMLAYADTTELLPDGLAYEQAAPIFCAGYTVYSGLRAANPQPHERIAIIGVGGLGHLGVQYAHATGFETIAISHSPDKNQLVRDLGADEVVSNGDELVGIGGADIILVTSNSYKPAIGAIKGLRPGGRLVVMGMDSDPAGLPIPASDLIMKNISVIGSGQNGREFLYEALDYVAKGKVKVITETYPLDDINKAYDRVAHGEARFRAVIVP